MATGPSRLTQGRGGRGAGSVLFGQRSLHSPPARGGAGGRMRRRSGRWNSNGGAVGAGWGRLSCRRWTPSPRCARGRRGVAAGTAGPLGGRLSSGLPKAAGGSLESRPLWLRCLSRWGTSVCRRPSSFFKKWQKKNHSYHNNMVRLGCVLVLWGGWGWMPWVCVRAGGLVRMLRSALVVCQADGKPGSRLLTTQINVVGKTIGHRLFNQKLNWFLKLNYWKKKKVNYVGEIVFPPLESHLHVRLQCL